MVRNNSQKIIFRLDAALSIFCSWTMVIEHFFDFYTEVWKKNNIQLLFRRRTDVFVWIVNPYITKNKYNTLPKPEYMCKSN